MAPPPSPEPGFPGNRTHPAAKSKAHFLVDSQGEATKQQQQHPPQFHQLTAVGGKLTGQHHLLGPSPVAGLLAKDKHGTETFKYAPR